MAGVVAGWLVIAAAWLWVSGMSASDVISRVEQTRRLEDERSADDWARAMGALGPDRSSRRR